jgi:hypothetical protein
MNNKNQEYRKCFQKKQKQKEIFLKLTSFNWIYNFNKSYNNPIYVMSKNFSIVCLKFSFS